MFEAVSKLRSRARRKPTAGPRRSPELALQLAVKRGFDLAFSALALIALAPLIVGIGFLLWHRTGASPWRLEPSLDVDGRRFQRLAFRAGPSGGPLPAFLRRSGLAGLPQLVNVLKGEMAVIGPAPRDAAGEAGEAPAMKPGLVVPDDEAAYAAGFSLVGDARIVFAVLRRALSG